MQNEVIEISENRLKKNLLSSIISNIGKFRSCLALEMTMAAVRAIASDELETYSLGLRNYLD